MMTRILLAGLLSAAPQPAPSGATAEPGSAAPPPPVAATTYAYLTSAATSRRPPGCLVSKVDDHLVRVPLFSSEAEACPAAVAGGSVITIRELAAVLALAHEGGGEHGAPRPAAPQAMDFNQALRRLIDSRLIAAEAHDMGIDQLPEVTSALQDYAAATEKSLLQVRVTRGIGPDAAEVARIYKLAVSRWKVRSVLFEKAEDAKAFQAALKGGKRFDELAKQLVAEKKATGTLEPEILTGQRMFAELRKAVEKTKPGEVAPTVKVPKGFSVLRVDEVTYPDDPSAKLEAQKLSVRHRREEAVSRYQRSLAKKHAVVDEKLMKSLDFEAAKPGFEALAKDHRVVATIQGEKSITVADIAAQLAAKFFHGVETPIKQHQVNPERFKAFEKVLTDRLYAREAAVRKIRETEAFRRELDDQRRALAFATFIEKVLSPDVKVTEEEAKKYYEQHRAEYTYPQFYKLESLAFATSASAQSTLKKLKAGTDWAWLRANGEGQLKDEARTLRLDGATLTAASLPASLAAALTGVSGGEYRLYAAGGAEHHVIHVIESTPSSMKPYPEARETIARKLFNEKLGKSIESYAGKLRAARGADVFIARIGS